MKKIVFTLIAMLAVVTSFAQNDIELISFNSSITYCKITNASLSIVVKNDGTNPITSFTAQYQIEDEEPIIEEVTGIFIDTSVTFTYSFTQPFSLSYTHDFTVTASVEIDNDDDISNNTIENFIELAPHIVTINNIYNPTFT